MHPADLVCHPRRRGLRSALMMCGETGRVVFWLVLGLGLALTAGESHAQSKSHRHQEGHQKACSRISQEFTKNRIGPASLVADRPIHDQDMEICYKGQQNGAVQTCCTRKMEKKYMQSAERDFYEVIRSTSSYLKNLLSSHAAQYQEQFLSLIQTAENNTGRLLGQVYKIPARDRHGAVENLFLDLQAYIKRREVSIHDSVSQFFDELFPPVFRNVLSDPQSLDLDEDYMECLTEIRRDLYPRPFGEVPHKLGHQLPKVMVAARTFLEALSLGIEAINTTDHLPLEQQCLKALTRLQYCSHCKGHFNARPCRNYCYNVMRGCLATVGEVDRHWDEFVDAIRNLTTSMKGTYSMEATLGEFHTRISEAIMHAMETTHKFYGKVVSQCGRPPSTSRDASQPGQKSVDMSTSVNSSIPSSEVKLHGKIDTFMRSLLASKGFYRNLADTLCSAEKFATGMDQERCWTGESLSRYNKSLIAVGLHPQMEYNPEMKVLPGHSSVVTLLVDKLRHVIKLLKSKVSSEGMQADDWSVKYGSWGSGDDTQVDDEDYMDASGSGSGGGSYPGYRPRKPNRQPAYGGDPDIYMVEDNPTKPPPAYVTQRTSRGSVPLSQRPLMSVLVVICVGLWVNG